MQETAVRFAICDDDKTYAEKMKALILQTFQLPQPVECVIYLNQEQILKCYREDKIEECLMQFIYDLVEYDRISGGTTGKYAGFTTGGCIHDQL